MTDLRLTRAQLLVLTFLACRDGRWTSPTYIGRVVGGRTASGLPRYSSWASPKCKALVEKGLAERNNDGQYRATLQGLRLAEKGS